MDDSPLISPIIKEYCAKFDVENILNSAINEVMLKRPSDPYSLFCNILKKHSQTIFKIEKIELLQKLTQNLSMALALDYTLSFQGNSQKVFTYFLPYNSKELSEKANTNPEEIITLFDNYFSKALTGYDIEQFTTYDKYILNLVQNANDTDAPIISLLGHSLSVSTLLAMAKMNNSNNIEFINNNIALYKLNNTTIPDLGFILFKTGKEMNSKVKFERWILFLNNSKKMPFNDLKDAFSKIYLAIRKFLTAGKAGEAGMRLNDEGSYFPPTDVMNDIFKLIENIISEIGMADCFYYGIDCNGNNYYNQETNTYEMDGFKKPPDNDQLIDFYIKLCKDHPLLKYLEDPLSNNDLRGYSKLMEKFSTECPDVKISLKRLIEDKLNNLSHIIDKEEENQGTGGAKMNTLNPLYRSRLIHNDPRPEDIKEELTELEKKKKEEEEERKRKEEEEKKRLEEEEAKRLEEEEAKLNKGKKKPEPKKPEVKKPNAKKTEEELRKEKEEEEKNLPPPIPFTKLKDISINFGNFSCLTEMNEIIQKIKQNNIGLSIYDNVFESNQSAIIDYGIGLHFNRIILHGFTINPDKKEKLIEYLNMVEKIY